MASIARLIFSPLFGRSRVNHSNRQVELWSPLVEFSLPVLALINIGLVFKIESTSLLNNWLTSHDCVESVVIKYYFYFNFKVILTGVGL